MPNNNAALRTMADWIAAIADNVKNPIAGIGAALAIAETQMASRHERGWDPAILEQSFEMIRARLDTLSEYVGELVDFAKPASLSPTTLAPRAVLTAACNALQGRDRYGIDISIDVRPDTPPLFADAAQVQRALSALLMNAVEALGGVESPRVHISALPGPTPASVAIVVEDNGPGLTGEARDRATEPFFSTKEAGTGLGLTLVAKCARGHGGTLGIDRAAQLGGCRVTLTFPPAAAVPPKEA